MKKISYSLVFNRKKKLNKKGMALVQVEAYLNSYLLCICRIVCIFARIIIQCAV